MDAKQSVEIVFNWYALGRWREFFFLIPSSMNLIFMTPLWYIPESLKRRWRDVVWYKKKWKIVIRKRRIQHNFLMIYNNQDGREGVEIFTQLFLQV